MGKIKMWNAKKISHLDYKEFKRIWIWLLTKIEIIYWNRLMSEYTDESIK